MAAGETVVAVVIGPCFTETIFVRSRPDGPCSFARHISGKWLYNRDTVLVTFYTRSNNSSRPSSWL
jgi:hypothetical protein